MFKKSHLKNLFFVFCPFFFVVPVVSSFIYKISNNNLLQKNHDDEKFSEYLKISEQKTTLLKKIKDLELKLLDSNKTILQVIDNLKAKVSKLDAELVKLETDNKDLLNKVRDYDDLKKFSLKVTKEPLKTNKTNVWPKTEYSNKRNQKIINFNDLGVGISIPEDIQMSMKLLNYNNQNGQITLGGQIIKGKISQQILVIIGNFKSNDGTYNEYITEIGKYDNKVFDLEQKLHSHDIWLDVIKIIIKKSGKINNQNWNEEIFQQIIIKDNQGNNIGNEIITTDYTQDENGYSLKGQTFPKSFVLVYKKFSKSFNIILKNFLHDDGVLDKLGKALQDKYKSASKQRVKSTKFSKKTPSEIFHFLKTKVKKDVFPDWGDSITTSITFFELITEEKIVVPKGVILSVTALENNEVGSDLLEFNIYLFKNHITRSPVDAYIYGFQKNTTKRLI